MRASIDSLIALPPTKRFLSLVLACSLLASASLKSEPTKLLVTKDLSARYSAFLGARSPLDIKHYYSPERGRQFAEALLFHQAIALGGYHKPIELWESPKNNYSATIAEIATAHVAAMAVTGWREDAQKLPDKLYISSPIIRQGEYQVGLYAHSANAPLLEVTRAQQLEPFTAVSNRHWSADWRALNHLNLSKIYDIPSWMAHLKMLATRRVDFMLLPFQNTPDLSLYYNPQTRTYLPATDKSTHAPAKGIRLIPVPGIKLRISGERCFYVSKQHPEGAAIYAALEIGLKQLRESGAIEQAMRESKFFHPATKDWVVIN